MSLFLTCLQWGSPLSSRNPWSTITGNGVALCKTGQIFETPLHKRALLGFPRAALENPLVIEGVPELERGWSSHDPHSFEGSAEPSDWHELARID